MIRAIQRAVWWLFYQVEEPRIIRLFQFVLYVTMFSIGLIFMAAPPGQYESVLGDVLAYILGGFILLGGALGAIGVLPGFWWIERLGVIALWTGLGIYIIVSFSVQATPLGVGVGFALILAMAIRWIQIREFQFAPGR